MIMLVGQTPCITFTYEAISHNKVSPTCMHYWQVSIDFS